MTTLVTAVDNDTGAEILGHIVPRVFTPPLVTGPPGPCGCGCALTPETSDGFEAIEFAIDVLLVPPDPWQRWLLIHALELLPDGRPRFRRVLVLVARQNGKTYLMSILANYWMYLRGPMNILGSSTKTEQAAKAWKQAITHAQAVPELAAEIPAGRGRGIKTGSGKESWTLANGSVYSPVAANEDGGRGDPLDRVIADELRSHKTRAAYGASYHAMRARPYAQWFGISSMGSDRSVVLNELRDAAVKFIETGDGDPRLGLFGWMPPSDADPLDPEMIAMANPNVGRRFPMEDILAEARVAVASGGEALTDHLTEAMCIHVKALALAIDLAAWRNCLTADPIGFADLRGRVAICLDVAKSRQSATLYAAAVQPDGKVRIGLAAPPWTGTGCGDKAIRELPAIVARIKPRALGWLPSGPAAEQGSALGAVRPGVWPPRGVTVEEIRGDLPQVAMGFAALVEAGQLVRGEEPLIDGQVEAAEKLPRGDAWVFSRKGEGDCDALYAAAGAAHLARQLPPPPGNVRVLLPRQAT